MNIKSQIKNNVSNPMHIVIGWLWKGNDLGNFIRKHSEWNISKLWIFSIKFVTPAFLTVLLVFNIIAELQENYEGYPTEALIYVGLIPILAAPLIGFALDKLTESSKRRWFQK